MSSILRHTQNQLVGHVNEFHHLHGYVQSLVLILIHHQRNHRSRMVQAILLVSILPRALLALSHR